MSELTLTLVSRHWRRPQPQDGVLWPLALFCLLFGLLFCLSMLSIFVRFAFELLILLPVGLFLSWIGVALLEGLLFSHSPGLTLSADGLTFAARRHPQERRLYRWEEIAGFQLERVGRRRVLLMAHTPPIGSGCDPWQDPGMDGGLLVPLPQRLNRSPEVLLNLLERWRMCAMDVAR